MDNRQTPRTGSRSWALTRWLLAAAVLALAAGCDNRSFSEKKAEVQDRWLQARARVLCRVAENRLTAGELDAAADAARQALVLQASSHDAKLVLARVCIEQGRYAVAIDGLKKAIEARPHWPQAVYLLGVAQEKRGKLTEALASYRRAYALDESDLAPVKAAAEVLVAMGEARRAQLQIDSYLPKADEDPGMYELAGRLAMMNQEYDRAVEHYQQARDLDHKNLRYAEALGRAQYAAGRFEETLETLGELLDREGYKPLTAVHMMIGDAYLATDKPSQAFNAYFSATEQAPRTPAVWTAVARAALAMKDNPRAVLAARKALQLSVGELEAGLLLGYALLRDGQADEAVRTLTLTIAGHPESPMAHCLLGRARAAAGDRAEAVRCYNRALQLDPGHRVARELLAAAGGERLSRID